MKYFETMPTRYDYKKSGTILLSGIQRFKSSHNWRTTTKDYQLFYTSSWTQTSEQWTLVLFQDITWF